MNSVRLFLQLELLGTIMELAFVPSIIAVSIVCYIFINRHFRRVGGYTEKVKRMQAKLTTSIFMQVMLIYTIALSFFYKTVIS